MAKLCGQHRIVAVMWLLTTLASVTLSGDVCKVYNSTYIDCSWRGWKGIPDKLPTYVTHLDLTQNEIGYLPPYSFTGLNKLQTLNISRAAVKVLQPKCFQGLQQLRHLDIQSNLISELDNGIFHSLPTLETLDISINDVRVIPDFLFSSLTNLKTLDLSTNQIMTLSNASLNGLANFRELHLSYNWITRIPSDVFQGLKSLQLLDLQGNNLLCYPNNALQPLVNIKQLTLAGNHLNSKCSQIDLRKHEKLRDLTLPFDMFTGLSDNEIKLSNFSLDVLTLTGKFLECTQNGTFSSVHTSKLRFKLTGDGIDSTCFERLLFDFKNTDIKVLSMNYPLYYGNVKFEITTTTFKGLQNTKLEELLFSHSSDHYITIPRGSFQWLPYLKTLDLSYNSINILSKGTFHGLKNLRTLILDHNPIYNIPLGVFDDVKSLKTLKMNFCQLNMNFYELLDSLQNASNLEVLHLSHNKLSGTITFIPFNSLCLLNISYNNIRNLVQESFISLKKLEVLDISFNFFYEPSYEIFSPLIALQYLDVRGNDISFSLIFQITIFENLTYLAAPPSCFKLESLNSSSLQHLTIEGTDAEMFDLTTVLGYLPNLQTFKIVKGRITINYYSNQPLTITPLHSMRSLALEHVKFLNPGETSKFLNLFPNIKKLSLIDVHAINNMEELLMNFLQMEELTLIETSIALLKVKHISKLHNLNMIILYNNPLDCSGCNMKEFQNWLKTDKNVWVPAKISCLQPTDMRGKEISLLTFGWECNIVFLASLIATCSLAFAALCIGLCIHFRWYIRYVCFLLKLKRGGYEPHVNDEEQPLNIIYDAFVCYNEKDRDWVMQQLVPNLENIDPPNFKLCLHERDFMPGIDIFDNILESIENSHKTMLILSPGFAQSEWCYFEMRMAQDHLFRERRNLLLLVLLHEIPDNAIPRILRKMLLTQKYIKWTENEVGQRLFWEKLKISLKSDNRVNRVANM